MAGEGDDTHALETLLCPVATFSTWWRSRSSSRSAGGTEEPMALVDPALEDEKRD